MDDKIQAITKKLQENLSKQAQRSSEIHQEFLQQRQASLEQMGTLLEMQMGGARTSSTPEVQPDARIEIFSASQMSEFALGSMASCFGPEFEIFEGRRHPRIPNTQLMLMSRALEIKGKRMQFDKPSSIVTKYDVPAEAWFFRDNSYPHIPYSVWMELALQPCGFLSAYLGTMLLFPEIDYYFRNLDGATRLLSERDLRGKTIRCQATLLSTITSGTTIIQKFSFDLSCEGQPVFEGTSIFGFFPPEGMVNQAGLDSGQPTLPMLERDAEVFRKGAWLDLKRLSSPPPGKPFYRLSTGQIDFLDRIFFAPGSAQPSGDYLCALKENQPSAWFYPCHFYQDPVMPGSLGVEAIQQTIQAYILALDLGKHLHSPRFGLPAGQPVTWRYRGQILPSHKQMKLEVKITSVQQSQDKVLVEGDASLWADTLRIYEVKHAAVSLSES